MTAILILITIGGCINNVASSSRQLWSFARDEGLPFSKFLAHVGFPHDHNDMVNHPTNKPQVTPGWDLPLNAVALSFIIAVLLSLINIGSTFAFDAIASLGVVALISSYMISISCITIKKLRGEPLPPSKWKLPKRYGLAINIISVLYLILVFIMSFFPLATPVNPQSMNWNCLVYGAVVIFALIYYFVRGKYHYSGPVVHVKPIYDE
jgi:choline transport protein